MKYIRTKDGKIYEVVGERVNGIRLYSWQLENINKNEGNFYFDGNNICEKVADTIKELCDDFIVCHPELDDGLPFILPRRDGSLENKFKLLVYCKVFPYGAIWTGKGLIYVAKLNEKGEWELI